MSYLNTHIAAAAVWAILIQSATRLTIGSQAESENADQVRRATEKVLEDGEKSLKVTTS